MIIECPNCGAKYNVDKSKVTGAGKKAKCYKCGVNFPIVSEELERLSKLTEELNSDISNEEEGVAAESDDEDTLTEFIEEIEEDIETENPTPPNDGDTKELPITSDDSESTLPPTGEDDLDIDTILASNAPKEVSDKGDKVTETEANADGDESPEPSDDTPADDDFDIDNLLANNRPTADEPAQETDAVSDNETTTPSESNDLDVDSLLANNRPEESKGEDSAPTDTPPPAEESKEEVSSQADSPTEEGEEGIVSQDDLESLLSGEGPEDKGDMGLGESKPAEEVETLPVPPENATEDDEGEKKTEPEAEEEKPVEPETLEEDIVSEQEPEPVPPEEVESPEDRNDLEEEEKGESIREEDDEDELEEEPSVKDKQTGKIKIIAGKILSPFKAILGKMKKKAAEKAENIDDLSEGEKVEEAIPKKSRKKYIIAAVVFFIVIILAIAAVAFLKSRNKKTPEKGVKEGIVKKKDTASTKMQPKAGANKDVLPTTLKRVEKIPDSSVAKKEPTRAISREGAIDTSQRVDVIQIGVIMPVYKNLEEIKVLDMILNIKFTNSKVANFIRNNIPFYEENIEKSIERFFGGKFYDDMHFVKGELANYIKDDMNKNLKSGKVKHIRIEFFRDPATEIKEETEANKEK